MTDDAAYFIAPFGPMPADVRLAGGRPWIAIALGAAVIAVGWLLLS